MKIKLRDLTEEQYEKWQNKNCFNPTTNCEKCVFNNVSCDYNAIECWINNKDLYSNKFLNQEIELECELILTDKEKEFLSAITKPFRNEILYIVKKEMESITGDKYNFITIKMSGVDSIDLLRFPVDKYYKNIRNYEEYTLEELGL